MEKEEALSQMIQMMMNFETVFHKEQYSEASDQLWMMTQFAKEHGLPFDDLVYEDRLSEKEKSSWSSSNCSWDDSGC